MDDCRYFEEQISASLDGELSATEEIALRQHLQHCESCRAYQRLLRALETSDREALPAVPANLTGDIMAAVRSAAPKKKKAVIYPFPRRVRALAAAAALVILAGWAGARLLSPPAASLRGAGAPAPEAPKTAFPSMAAAESAPAAPAAGAAAWDAGEEAEEPEMSSRAVLFDAAPAENGPLPFLLRSADGWERHGADCSSLWMLGEPADLPVPERAPDFTVLDEDGTTLWQLWEEDNAVLFREGADCPLFSAHAQDFWDTLPLS